MVFGFGKKNKTVGICPTPDPKIAEAKTKKFLQEELTEANEKLELDPNNAESLLRKIEIINSLELRREKHEDPWPLMERYLELTKNGDEHFSDISYRPIFFKKLVRYEEAMACYDKVLESEPGDFDALSDKGKLLAKLGKHEEAIACFDKILELYSDPTKYTRNKYVIYKSLPDILYFKGKSLHKLGRHEDAIALAERGFP